jgi:Plasmid stabilization system protein
MYKLSNRAVEDFESIYEYTWKKFGQPQADKYTSDLDATFRLLAANPLMGQNCSYLLEGARQHSHRQHLIFYQYTDYGLLVIRILHQHMKPILHFR